MPEGQRSSGALDELIPEALGDVSGFVGIATAFGENGMLVFEQLHRDDLLAAFDEHAAERDRLPHQMQLVVQPGRVLARFLPRFRGACAPRGSRVPFFFPPGQHIILARKDR